MSNKLPVSAIGNSGRKTAPDPNNTRENTAVNSSLNAADDILDDAPAAAVDLETRLTQDHHQSLKLWLRMLSCTLIIENEIRTRLRNNFDISLARFDLMAQLERYPNGLRMGELSKRMMVTGGNVTGLTDQLEREKQVVRVPDPNDRRAYSVKLTPAGRRAFEQMAAVHEGWIAELMGGLPMPDKSQLLQSLSQLKKQLNQAVSDNRVQDKS